MTGDVRKRVFRGLAGQGFSQAVTIAIQLVSLPIFLAYWGVELYGEWLILTAIPSYLLMSDLGFGGTASREMVMLVAGGRRDKALCVFQSIWFLVTLVSVLLILISGVVFYYAPIVDWFHFSILDESMVIIILTMIMLQVLFSLQGEMIYAGYSSEGHYGLGIMWLTFIRLAEFVTQMLVVILGYGPIEALAGALVARSGCTLLMRVNLYKISPWVVYGVTHLRFKEIKRLTKPAISALAFPMGQAINLQGARVIIGMVMGPVAVVTFTALRTLARFILMALTMINKVVGPEISIAYGKKDMKLLRRLYRKSCQLALWAGITLCLAMYIMGETLLQFWTSGKIAMDNSLFLVMLIASVLQATWSAGMSVLYATNQHSRVAVYFIIISILFLGLSYYLLLNFNITSMMMALAAAEAAMLFLVIPSSLNFIDDTFKAYISEVVKPPYFLIKFLRKNKTT